MGRKILSNCTPQSEYNSTFQFNQLALQTGQRSLKIPMQIIPSQPNKKMDLKTVNQTDFTVLPFCAAKSYKPKGTYYRSAAQFMDETSYKTEFPERQVNPTVQTSTSPRSTLPNIVDCSPMYETTNKVLMKPWQGNHIPLSYCEPIQNSLFKGKFEGNSVFKTDFNDGIVKNFKPRTSYKKKELLQKSDGEFDDRTTNKESFRLPQLADRKQNPLYLKNNSKRSEETMEPISGLIAETTQYSEDHPGFEVHPKKRKMCLPYRDTLLLTSKSYSNSPFVSIHKASYTGWDKPVRPSTPCKKALDYYKSNAPFVGSTQYNEDFQCSFREKQLHCGLSAEEQAAILAYDHKNGQRMKEAHYFGGKFLPFSVNQSDYFNFNKVQPRIRHSDKHERIYKSSLTKFQGISDYKASFIPLQGNPAKSCKPLDLKIKNEERKETKEKLSNTTAYREHYPERPLIPKDICPAEILLL